MGCAGFRAHRWVARNAVNLASLGKDASDEEQRKYDLLADDWARWLPAHSLLVADAGFTSFDLLWALSQRHVEVLVRMGSHRTLLTGGVEDAVTKVKGQRVWLWPQKKQKQYPPLTLRVVRWAMRWGGGLGGRGNWVTRLRRGVKDDYVRRGLKATRLWPRKKRDHPPGVPKLREATACEKHRAATLYETTMRI